MKVTEEFTIDDVQIWLETCNNGTFSNIRKKLDRSNGERLLSYTREELCFILQDHQAGVALYKILHPPNFSKLLPIGITPTGLLDATETETLQIAFEKDWNTGEPGERILHTVTAYSNNLFQTNGGYIFIGVEEKEGRPVRPVTGITGNLRRIVCKIEEKYELISGPSGKGILPRIIPCEIDSKSVILLWCPPSEEKPLSCPKTFKKNAQREVYVRKSNSTRTAQQHELEELRRTLVSRLLDVQASNMSFQTLLLPFLATYLKKINSKLSVSAESFEDTCIRHNFAKKTIYGEVVPTNLGLLFLTNDPSKFFPAAKIDIAYFRSKKTCALTSSKTITGPLNKQIHVASNLVNRNRFESGTKAPLPPSAVREAISNAVLHQSYEPSHPHPIRVSLYLDRVVITSYPGPHSAISLDNFCTGNVPQVPTRNPSIGKVLQSLKYAELGGTGIPEIVKAMKEWGNKEPIFQFDEMRTFFTVRT